ncbi:hypothetical protein OG756_41280 [Streptomyces sp. NBC_01310]|uniref:hypothetical protein n=1 Tax=Streptomyces sp. NBC_01310 TaxID=2903820 RepID=UPI0035B61641|nr:hypothetical protein OG756_00105 [Streptomyces sp. NBC_01310]WSJ63838.1 hypothetical protein OG756_41280 [Streptomyces sp. NBC_01310]
MAQEPGEAVDVGRVQGEFVALADQHLQCDPGPGVAQFHGDAVGDRADEVVEVAHRLHPGQLHPRGEEDIVRLGEGQQHLRSLERHEAADRVAVCGMKARQGQPHVARIALPEPGRVLLLVSSHDSGVRPAG